MATKRTPNENYGAIDPPTDAPIVPPEASGNIESGNPSKPASVVPMQPRALPEARLTMAEQARNTWRVTVPSGTPIEDAVKPGYWAHVATKLRIYDRIEIMPDDGTWIADALVRDVGRHSATLAILSHWELEPLSIVGDLGDFEIEHLASLGWCVRRKSDGSRVSERHATKSAAAVWVAENGARHSAA